MSCIRLNKREALYLGLCISYCAERNIGPFCYFDQSNVENTPYKLGDYTAVRRNDRESLCKAVNELMAENKIAFDSRYDEVCENIIITPNDFTNVLPYLWDLQVTQALKFVNFYCYQTSDSPTYKKSTAYAIAQALKTDLTNHLPHYEKANWGIPDSFDNLCDSLGIGRL